MDKTQIQNALYERRDYAFPNRLPKLEEKLENIFRHPFACFEAVYYDRHIYYSYFYLEEFLIECSYSINTFDVNYMQLLQNKLLFAKRSSIREISKNKLVFDRASQFLKQIKTLELQCL